MWKQKQVNALYIPQYNNRQTSEGDGSDGEDGGVTQGDLEALLTGCYPKAGDSSTTAPPAGGKWVCAQSSEAKKENHKQHIADKLEVLAKAYTHQGNKWRAQGYSKAINALQSYHKTVSSFEEACKIQGIGKRMAEKIKEILESGHPRKLDHIGESVPVLELFSNIWGAGAKTAQMWYQQEMYVSLYSLLASTISLLILHCIFPVELLLHTWLLLEMVWEMTLSLNPGLWLISEREGHVWRHGCFLTGDLVSHEDNGNQKMYLGVCRLPGPGRRHRRLDIIVVPYSEFACALMHFMGSAHFNRYMRALAKTKTMSLSEHSLNRDVLRKGSLKVTPGLPLPTPAEKVVFTHLGLPYREPQERDW
ncbi:DNA polymerase lambda-like [Acipenser ruthenus]|uniref:DNA polymerase lambda-like n=1 Tax=Acipenser ruthenus TaxID=7906 RepID=UPI00274054E4|nr:DNA polymerase lambda-like [Acipenser ruthenus]